MKNSRQRLQIDLFGDARPRYSSGCVVVHVSLQQPPSACESFDDRAIAPPEQRGNVQRGFGWYLQRQRPISTMGSPPRGVYGHVIPQGLPSRNSPCSGAAVVRVAGGLRGCQVVAGPGRFRGR